MSTLSDETMKILTDIDEMVMDETEKDVIQYDSIDFILQNIRFAHDEIFNDESQLLASRRNISKTVVLQMLFYTACLLKPFTVRRKAPIILILGGEGYIGSQLVLQLCEFGLSPYITIFSRGMMNASHWQEKGIRMISTLEAVSSKDDKFDIVIYSADLAAFPSVARLLTHTGRVNEATAFITCTLGLQRRRVFNFLSTTAVLRTFVEHSDAIKRSFNTLDKTTFLNAAKHMKQALTLTIPLESDFLGSHLSEEAYAADLIARRCNDIRHLIFVIENNYVVRGVHASNARNYALHMVLGHIDSLKEVDDSKLCMSDSMQAISDVLQAMQDSVLTPFQVQLSKYIRVIDLPELLQLAVRVDAPNQVTDNLLMDIHNQQTGGASIHSGETMDIAFEDLLLESDENSVNSSESRLDSSRVDPLDLNSVVGNNNKPKRKGKVPSKLAEKQKEKEEKRKGLESLHAELRKRKMMLDAQRRLQNDDLYNNVHPPMHSEEVLLKIFDNDLKSETALIGLPARVQALIGEIDDEILTQQKRGASAGADVGGSASLTCADMDDDEEDCMNEAFEGFLRLPKLSHMAIATMSDTELAKAHFVSTLRTDDDDMTDMSSAHLITPSQIAASPDKQYLSIEPGAPPVLVETMTHKGFLSVLHDRVIDDMIQFANHGGIEVIHEGIAEEDENKDDEEENEANKVDEKDLPFSNNNSTPMSRQVSNAAKDVANAPPTNSPMPVMSRSNSTKYAMMRSNSNRTLNTDTSRLTSPSGSSGGVKPTAPSENKSSRQKASKR